MSVRQVLEGVYVCQSDSCLKVYMSMSVRQVLEGVYVSHTGA
jgi:hypothetical protein